MRPLVLCEILLVCALHGHGHAQHVRVPPPPPQHEIALDAGLFAGEVSYARRGGAAPVSVGLGVWGAWEPASNFDRNVWEPIGLDLFVRYAPALWLHIDTGAVAARYLWADDCSDCTGTLVGGQSGVYVGWRGLFIGPEVSIGRASDREHGSELGTLWGVRARLLHRWGGP